MKIKTKAESVQLYESGMFGNKGLTWKSPQEFYASGYDDFVVLRYRDPGHGGAPCVYNLKGFFEVQQAVRFHVEKGWDESRIWINAQMPDDAIIIQGEYWIAQDYVEAGPGAMPLVEDLFKCSTAKLQMRDALREDSRQISGLAARETLRQNMDHRSWNNFKWIREAFPGHAVEIGVYSRPVGLLNWNSVVWEVRSY